MRRILKTSAAALALAAAGATVDRAAAQNIADVFDADDADVIIVTAQKREQDIRDVPLAVSAFEQSDLDALGVQQFDDLADFVPGLEVQEQSANNPGFVIRGITSDSGDATIEPRVAIFQDNVPISRSRGSFVELFDTDVEVARGPQPTLFGRSALIGAVSLKSRRPVLGELSGNVRVGGGNFDFLLAEGAFNFPLGDKAAVRFATRYKERAGYVENLIEDDLNGFALAAFRGSLRIQPIDTLTIDAIFNYQKDDNPGTSFKSGTFLPRAADGTLGVLDPGAPAALSSFGGIEGGRPLGLERDVTSATLLIDWELSPGVTLSSVTNYREFESSEVFDADGFDLPLFAFAENADGEQFFQEIRLGFENFGGFSGFIGGSIFDEEGRQNVPLFYDERVAQALIGQFLFSAPPGVEQVPPPLAALPPVALGPTGAPALLDPNDPTSVIPLSVFNEEFTNFGDNTSYDLFVDATYAITDRLDVTAGVRWTQDDKRSLYSANSNGVSALTGAGIFVGANVFNGGQPVGVSDDFDGLSWRFAVKYDVADNATVYANYGRGRRPEVLGFEADVSEIGVDPDNFFTVEAETTDAFELGLKGDFFGRLTTDIVGYYYEYTNFQTSVLNDVGASVPVNGGNASGFGFEGQATFEVTDNFLIFSSYAFNGVEFDDEDEDGATQIRAGNRFRLAPEHALAVGGALSYDCRCGAFRLTPIYAWRSEIFFDDDNDRPELQGGVDLFEDERQGAYGTLDLRLVYEPSFRDGVVIEAFVENLTDTDYLLDAGNTGDAFGIPTFIAGPPRTWGVYLSVAF